MEPCSIQFDNTCCRHNICSQANIQPCNMPLVEKTNAINTCLPTTQVSFRILAICAFSTVSYPHWYHVITWKERICVQSIRCFVGKESLAGYFTDRSEGKAC